MSDRTMDRLMRGIRQRNDQREAEAWRTLPEDAQPWAGWVYSTCNLDGHPDEAHWHPPVGQRPTRAATPDASALRTALERLHFEHYVHQVGDPLPEGESCFVCAALASGDE